MKKAPKFRWPAVAVNQTSGTLILDPDHLQTLNRMCGAYAIGKMLAKHGVPIRTALKILQYKVVPRRLIVLLRTDRIALTA